MEIELITENGLEILTPIGRVDTSSAKIFEENVMESIDRCNKIIIAFNKIDYISSAGLRIILMAGKKLKTKQGNIILCGMADKVKDVFRMSGFDKMLKIVSTMEEAKQNVN